MSQALWLPCFPFRHFARRSCWVHARQRLITPVQLESEPEPQSPSRFFQGVIHIRMRPFLLNHNCQRESYGPWSSRWAGSGRRSVLPSNTGLLLRPAALCVQSQAPCEGPWVHGPRPTRPYRAGSCFLPCYLCSGAWPHPASQPVGRTTVASVDKARVAEGIL